MKYSLAILLFLLSIGMFAKTRLDVPVIHTVEVIETSSCPNCIRLEWDSVPGADFYEILKYDPTNQNGFPEPYPVSNPYVNTNSFIDNNSYALNRSEKYHVVARDTSDSSVNDSEWSDTVATLYLKPIIYDSCNMEIKLNWIGYLSNNSNLWYQILRSKDGVLFDKIDSTKNENYSDDKLEANTLYTYKITIESGLSSNSNKREIDVRELLVPDKSKQKIFMVTSEAGQSNIQVGVDNQIQVESYDLFSSDNAIGDFDKQESSKFAGNTEISYSVENSTPRKYYRMQTKNMCSVYVDTTNTIRPIELKITQVGNDITLDWYSGFVENENEEHYLVTFIDGEIQPIQLLENHNFTYQLDLGVLGGEYSESFIFQIRNIDSKDNVVMSNKVEALKTPFLKMPNAFTPNNDGLNDEIGPFQNYIENADASLFRSFKFIVYDKYGGVVYESDNSSESWDGTKSGSSLSEGPYLTYIKFVTAKGRTVEENKMIEIVYP